MENATFIQQANALIEQAANQPLTLDQRIENAIKLAGLILEEAHRVQTTSEKQQQAQLAGMMNDPNGKNFTTSLTDQCFRSHRNERIANQMRYVLDEFGVPGYLSWFKRLGLQSFKALGEYFPSLTVPLAREMLRKETSNVILPGEPKELAQHMQKRRKEGIRINLNHLGEAILGEEEALKRLETYLDDLKKPEVEYISVKISTICSQLNLLAWDETLKILSDRLRQLYQASRANYYVKADGTALPKFVNLDMEEYRDLHLTVALFKKVLEEEEFKDYSAGIVLQSYLPDSYETQQELTEWARERLAKGGAPIKIRIVKGANLAMEQVEAALRGWPQAPYPSKANVDANYKRMVTYAFQKDNAQAAHIGIGSHNLFDIAYALLLRAENQVQPYVCFEMLEGMADHMRRVVQTLSKDMLLYCPAATKEEFQNAIAYLVRRLDENTAPENFLRHSFDLHADTPDWEEQGRLFKMACYEAGNVSAKPRRQQNRSSQPFKTKEETPFFNEPDTDWSLRNNQSWIKNVIEAWKKKPLETIPCVIGGFNLFSEEGKQKPGYDPSFPSKPLYHYTLAEMSHANQALETAKKQEETWGKSSVEERSILLCEIANQLRLNRGELIAAMMADTGKTVAEADVEISEAIDFAEYYRWQMKELASLKDIKWKPKGTVLVTPPWNFPCSIPLGGILAALATGNCVIFKPAPEAILVGWTLVNLCWKAGISRETLQFIVCEDQTVGTNLLKDPRINLVVLTGATSTAKLFMKLRPEIDLMAETGGKNALIITGMADRDLAIKDLTQSAFGHAGQKCSACSLAICEAEVYDDPHFLQQLKDAVASLKVGSPWNLSTRLNPLIRPAEGALLKGFTTLEEGEEWLLEPKPDPENPQLWSPGIKLGVKQDSFMHHTELFGPVLGLMRANDLHHAIELANGTPYGLTSGLHSLDEREHQIWIDRIEAGNCYINRGITGAIVQRQPFGGCKASSFGPGTKAGGPNYLIHFMHAEQKQPPKEQEQIKQDLSSWNMPAEDYETLRRSVGSYQYYWDRYFSQSHDPSRLRGQDNFLFYTPHKKMTVRIQAQDTALDMARIALAAAICQMEIEISIAAHEVPKNSLKGVTFVKETEENFVRRIQRGGIERLRFLSSPKSMVFEAMAKQGVNHYIAPVLANGRLELVNNLREVSLSVDYHRYGNLGVRENDYRRPLPEPCENNQEACLSCSCEGK